MRILLVEDEEDLGLAIKQVLMGEKYVVDWVTDGAQAWYCLENQWTDYTVAIIELVVARAVWARAMPAASIVSKLSACTDADRPGPA